MEHAGSLVLLSSQRSYLWTTVLGHVGNFIGIYRLSCVVVYKKRTQNGYFKVELCHHVSLDFFFLLGFNMMKRIYKIFFKSHVNCVIC